MSSVRVDEDAMRERAAQFCGQARCMGEFMEDLGSLSASMQTEWAGRESDSFAEWYHTEFKPSLIKGQVVIGQFANEINTCADQLARAHVRNEES